MCDLYGMYSKFACYLTNQMTSSLKNGWKEGDSIEYILKPGEAKQCEDENNDQFKNGKWILPHGQYPFGD